MIPLWHCWYVEAEASGPRPCRSSISASSNTATFAQLTLSPKTSTGCKSSSYSSPSAAASSNRRIHHRLYVAFVDSSCLSGHAPWHYVSSYRYDHRCAAAGGQRALLTSLRNTAVCNKCKSPDQCEPHSRECDPQQSDGQC